jgi:hypothetical protein
MNTFIRFVTVNLCLGVLALGIVIVDLVGRLTGPPQRDLNQQVTLTEELARTERLSQLREASFRRVDSKRLVAEEVIAGRRSLAEAIEEFRDLDRQWPDVSAGIKIPEHEWMSEDEWYGRAVIGQVRQVLADRPDEAATVIGRLEKELRLVLAAVSGAATSPRPARSSALAGTRGVQLVQSILDCLP